MPNAPHRAEFHCPPMFPQRTIFPMLPRLRFFLLLPLAALLACGSNTSTGGGNYAPTSGDYVFNVTPAGGGSESSFAGDLVITGSSVAGVFRYDNPNSACVSGTQDISVSGTIASNVLTLTSGAFSSSVATFTIKLPFDSVSGGSQLATGTVAIAGGSCALASSTLQAVAIPTYNGTWTGSLTGPVNGNLSLQITQSAADADGQFPVIAAVTYAGSTCSFTVTGVTGLVSGYTLSLGNGSSAPNNELAVSASATTSPVSVSLVTFSTPSCPAGVYSGNITE